VLSLQSTGDKLLEAAKTREFVLHAMGQYMRRVGLELRALPPVIHIAGTKGKGSTAAMTESILRAAGLRTGKAKLTAPRVRGGRWCTLVMARASGRC
jgi:folylpolyglutamate synthase/dihydropteroate synthase